MFKFSYNLPNFSIIVFLLGASIYDLFIVGNFYDGDIIMKVKDIAFLLIIIIIFTAFILNYRSKKQR